MPRPLSLRLADRATFEIVSKACCWAALLVLAGCAGPLRLSLKIPQEKLQQQLEKHFPLKAQVLLFEVSLGEPALLLEDGADRVGLRLALRAGLAGGLAYTGEVALDSGIDYQADSGALVLRAPRLRRFQIDQLSAALCRQLEGVVGPLLAAHLDGLPVYHLKEGKTRRRLKELRIEDGRVVAELGL